MVLPNLIHPVSVTLARISRATTVYDRDAREPVQHAARVEPVSLPGQLSSSLRTKAMSPGRGGRVENEDGYVLFRARDLETRGIDLQVGDRITKLGKVEVELYVHRTEPIGHYPDQSGHSLLKAFLRDRKPAKES